MERYRIDILGISESHLRDSGHFSSPNGNLQINAGTPDNVFSGVGFLISKSVARRVMGYDTISDRIVKLRISAIKLPNQHHSGVCADAGLIR